MRIFKLNLNYFQSYRPFSIQIDPHYFPDCHYKLTNIGNFVDSKPQNAPLFSNFQCNLQLYLHRMHRVSVSVCLCAYPITLKMFRFVMYNYVIVGKRNKSSKSSYTRVLCKWAARGKEKEKKNWKTTCNRKLISSFQRYCIFAFFATVKTVMTMPTYSTQPIRSSYERSTRATQTKTSNIR